MGSEQGRLTLRRHAHLRLATVLQPDRRRKRKGGFVPPPGHPDNARHGARLAQQVRDIQETHLHRTKVFGIDPDLVMVIEFSRDISPEELSRTDLHLLGYLPRQAFAAFASDPDLSKFDERRRAYQESPPRWQDENNTWQGKRPKHEAFFDAIEKVRPLKRADVIDTDLWELTHAPDPNRVVRLDIECWCTENEADMRDRHDKTKAAIESAGGTVINASCRFDVSFSHIRADVPLRHVRELADTQLVRRISRIAQPLLSHPEVARWGVDDFPAVLAPAPSAPIVAVIDSGIRAHNPLIAPAVSHAAALGHFADGSDEHGHGTLVSSLILYGSLEERLKSKQPLQPACRLVSIRVLGADGRFPESELWQEQLEQSIEMAAELGARVVNISIGDVHSPYRPPAPVPVAGMVDVLARKLGLVIVVSTGNFPGSGYVDDSEIVSRYPSWLCAHEEAGLLPPAMSALALTVGAVVSPHHQGVGRSTDSVALRPMGKPGAPSPVTRVGPGIEEMTKPELTAPGGSYFYDHDHREVRSGDERWMVVGAGAKPGKPDQLLASDAGTSYAAPIVTHAVARTLTRYPSISGNAARALVLASAEPAKPIFGTKAEGKKRQRKLNGFGQVDADRAELSDDQRVVLLAENRLEPDAVHFYRVPMPEAFFTRRNGDRAIAVALAFDPPTRSTRLTYLASRMSVHVYRGISVDVVREKFAEMEDADESPKIRASCEVKLTPSPKQLSLGANQLGTYTGQRAWEPQYRGDLVVAVRHTNRWAIVGEAQPYALALVFEVGPNLPDIYSELALGLEALGEVETEIELG